MDIIELVGMGHWNGQLPCWIFDWIDKATDYVIDLPRFYWKVIMEVEMDIDLVLTFSDIDDTVE